MAILSHHKGEVKMSDLETREGVRGLAEIVKSLVAYTRSMNTATMALHKAVQRFHPDLEAKYMRALDEPVLMEELDRLAQNADAIAKSLTTKS
jgi:hypothetical protein